MTEGLAFLKALQEAHDEDEHTYPVQYCIDLFEELNAVWAESVRESRRTLCAKLGTENPRLEDLKLIALALSESVKGTGQTFSFPVFGIFRMPLGIIRPWLFPDRSVP